MIAVVISVLVFSAMGSLLNRCFSLWLGAQAQWELAQCARVTRTRLLYGAFGTGTGLVNATNVTLGAGPYWDTVDFDLPGGAGTFRIYGWNATNTQQNIWIYSWVAGKYAWAQEVRYASGSYPVVQVNNFDASLNGDELTIAYTLNFSAMGKEFKLPQLIETRISNH
jgi:hypothetical protein